MRSRVLSLILVAVAVGGWAPRAVAASADDFEPWRGRTIASIRIEGNRVTRDYVITREILSEEGRPLDPEVLARDVTRLENLSIFGSVEVEVSEAGPGVDLNFSFTEMPSLLPFPALKWNEENGFSFGAGLTSPNLGGRGVSLSTKAVFGGTTNYDFRATNPWIAADHLSAELFVYHSEREQRLLEYDQDSDRAELTVGYYLGRHGRAAVNAGYWGVHADRDGITIDEDRRDDMWLAGLTLGYDSRDSWRVPHRGWRASISGGYLGGSASSGSVELDARRYQPLGENHTLAVGPLLSFQSGEVGRELPSYQQYFLGGSNSVRGYDLIELGRELYGSNRLLTTCEYRYLVLPVRTFPVLRWAFAVGIDLALFADAGVVWTEAREFSLDRTRFGYGAGVRFLLPVVEMLRLDVGISEFGDVEFNFGIRSVFEARAQPVY